MLGFNSIQDVFMFAGILSLIVTHEIGHAYVAKKQGIYKGWGMTPTPHIKMTRPFNNRFDYLSGLYGSLLSYPLFILGGWQGVIYFPIFAVTVSILDILLVFVYKQEWVN